MSSSSTDAGSPEAIVNAPAPQARPQPAGSSPPAKGGLVADNPNRTTGAAVHHDLYKHAADPGAERAHLKHQARVLGLGFFVFFCFVLGGLSFSFNHLWSAQPVVALPFAEDGPGLARVPEGDAPDADEVPRITDPGAFELVLEGGESVAAARLDGPSQGDDVDAAAARERAGVRVVIDGERVGTLYADRSGQVTAVRYPATAEDAAEHAALPGPRHAWQHARLAHTVRTRHLVYAGLAFGVVALALPVVLIPFYKFWMRFVAAPLGFVNTRIILGLVFFLMFTPLGLVRRLVAGDTLDRAPRPKGESYWKKRARQRDRKHFERLF